MKSERKMYLENAGSKKYGLVFWLLCVVEAALGLLFALLPLGKVDGISIGNSYDFLREMVNMLLQKKHTANMSAVCMLPFIVFGIILAVNSFSSALGVIIGFFAINVKKRELLLRKGFIQIALALLRVALIIVLYISIMVLLGNVPKLYGLKTNMVLYCVIEFLFIHFRGWFMSWFAFKYCNPQFDEQSESERKSNVATGLLFVVIPVLLIGIPFVFKLIADVTDIRHPKDAVWLLEGKEEEDREIDILFYQVHRTTYMVNDRYNWQIDMTDMQSEYTFYGQAYKYYYEKVQETQKEIDALEIEGEKDLKKAEQLEKELAVFEKKLSEMTEIGAYEYLRFDVKEEDGDVCKKFEVYYYDASPNKEDSIKWGKKVNFIDGIFNKESVRIVDAISYHKDLKFFVLGTDFTSNTIVVEMKYADGSYRMESITPDNAEELNAATAGKHTLKWSNEWGSYELEIEIREYEAWMDE